MNVTNRPIPDYRGRAFFLRLPDELQREGLLRRFLGIAKFRFGFHEAFLIDAGRLDIVGTIVVP